MIRLRKDFKACVVKSLGRGDDLVELGVPKAARAQHPELPDTMLLRRLLYQRKGFRPQALLTSLLDDKTYPATDVIEVYHERWEIELFFHQVKRFHALATRYENTARHYLALLHLACALRWLKQGQSLVADLS